jgi:hypothetical protein
MAPGSSPDQQFALLERLIRIETILNEGKHSDLDHEARIRQLESERHPDHETRLTDLNTRLRSVERAVWVAAGVAAALGGAVGGIVGPMIGGG